MINQPTVTEVRRSLVTAAQGYCDLGKPYGSSNSGSPEFTAWLACMSAANLAHLAAAMLRQIAEDHGEEYAASVAELATEAAQDGEGVYDANLDLIGSAS